MSIFFTADSHFDHKNIVKYCKRPFTVDYDGVREMNRLIIDRWNTTVKPEDTIYHLGDFAFTRKYARILALLDQLNGTIILIPGNHDKQRTIDAFKEHPRGRVITSNYSDAGAFLNIRINKQLITLCHFAMRVWDKSHFGSWHLYGHSHGSLPDNEYSLSTDIGVDRWDFTPVSIEQLQELFDKRLDSIKNTPTRTDEFLGGLIQPELIGDTEENWIKRNEE